MNFNFLLDRYVYHRPTEWILTFGLPHIGLGYISRSLSTNANILIFDVGISTGLAFPPPYNYIRININKYQRSLLSNLYISQNHKGSVFSNRLIFQESLLTLSDYNALCEYWSRPLHCYSIFTTYEIFHQIFTKMFPHKELSECRRIYDLVDESIRSIRSETLFHDGILHKNMINELTGLELHPSDKNFSQVNFLSDSGS